MAEMHQRVDRRVVAAMADLVLISIGFDTLICDSVADRVDHADLEHFVLGNDLLLGSDRRAARMSGSELAYLASPRLVEHR